MVQAQRIWNRNREAMSIRHAALIAKVDGIDEHCSYVLRIAFYMNQSLMSQTVLKVATRRLLRLHFEAGIGHIGGNLSCLDAMLCIYHNVMQTDDIFILSKGHSAGALYITLWSRGELTEEDLLTYHKDGTRLSVHPPSHGVPGVVFATGSLGHGVGLAAGISLGKRLRREAGRVFCLTSDGEWDEGSSWESLIFTAQHQLNVTIIVDANGMQGFGKTVEIADLEPLAEKFRSFRVPAEDVDGHDHAAVTSALMSRKMGPLAVVARTVKGNAVSFMQNHWQWHYLPMNTEQYQQALSELV